MRHHLIRAFIFLLLKVGLAVGQTPGESLSNLTTRLRQLRRGSQTPEFTTTAQIRAERLRHLIEIDPRAAVQSALPPDEAAAMRRWAPEFVETSGAWEGALEMRVEDDFSSGHGRTRYFLTTAADELEVFPSEKPAVAGCAPRVKVQGVRLAREVAGVLQVVAAATGCSTTGQQKVAVILINFAGSSLPANVTPAFVGDALFGTTRSLDTFWRENSYNLTSATGQVFGPYSTTVTSCSDLNAVRTAAIAAADADINFQQFTRVVIVHPNSGGCSIGVGTIGCGGVSSNDGAFIASTAWLAADYLQDSSHVISVAVHEAGHNLGLQHASTQDYGSVALGAPGAAATFNEYWDVFSAMGLLLNDGGTIIIGHYDAPQKATLGWLASGSGYQSVTASGTFNLLPYETATAGLKAIRIQRPGTNKWLWIEYRQSTGNFDNTLGIYSSNIYKGALVHYEDSSDPNYPQTLLLDLTPTAAPNNFSDAVLVGGGTWTDGWSTLKITIGTATATNLPVTVTMSPCDLNNDGITDAADIQLSVQKAIGLATCGSGDVNGNGACNIVDLQRIINAAGGKGCTTGL